MGSSLKHTVLAEGMETGEQLAFLQLHRRHKGQSYYFGRLAVADKPAFAGTAAITGEVSHST